MCGIAGIVAWSEEHRIKRETLERMAAAIAHRGPDGQRIWINHEDKITPDNPQVGFVFRRLAIIDLDERSMQPMHSPDGRYTVVFNGEIYNFKDLKSEISSLRPDHQWRTTGDGEVVLMSYAVWGEKCVEHFNGMFAIAVWDSAEKSLFLARDRMGQKPLYVNSNQGRASFASEYPAIDDLPEFEREFLMHEVHRYLAYGTMDLLESPHPCVMRVPPGTWLRITSRSPQPQTECYFDSGEGCSKGNPCETDQTAEPSIQAKRSVERAVERQLLSDVPLGVFLSGGIDSSVIAACARKHGPVKTFSISFDDPRYDESKYARAVATHLGTDHHEFHVTPNCVRDLPRLAEVFGEPFGDSSALPTHYLARETRQHVKVALSGDGGDELFGGYDRYVAMRRSARVPRAIGWMIAPLARPFAGGHPKARITRVARFASSLSKRYADRYESFLRIFDDRAISELVGAEKPIVGGVALMFSFEFKRTGDVVRAALATDRVTYLPNDLLTKVDRCSMMHGLEVRSPFMDHELVQFAAGLTTDQLLKGGPKRMLREAFKDDLPAWVFKRKKMGFAVPIGEWFRGELKPMLRDNLFASDAFGRDHFNMNVVERLVDEHETQRIDHSQRLYALLMLELWWRNQR